MKLPPMVKYKIDEKTIMVVVPLQREIGNSPKCCQGTQDTTIQKRIYITFSSSYLEQKTVENSTNLAKIQPYKREYIILFQLSSHVLANQRWLRIQIQSLRITDLDQTMKKTVLKPTKLLKTSAGILIYASLRIMNQGFKNVTVNIYEAFPNTTICSLQF